MAYNNLSKYHEDSDADDEFERGGWQNRDQIPVEYESSPTTSGPLSTEHTPTTFTHSRDSRISPTGQILDWDAEQVADFITDLGLEQYADTFVGRWHDWRQGWARQGANVEQMRGSRAMS